jgi:hypothetical protein
MIAYKLFRVKKNGDLTSLFINKTKVLEVGVWMEAHGYPTPGYVYRPYWHCTSSPHAPHLSLKGRAWYEVEMEDFTEFKRPECQGGIWYLAKQIKIIKKCLQDY